MAETAAQCLFQAIKTHGCRPAIFQVNSFNLAQALAELATSLKIKLLEVQSLPMIEEARLSLEAFSAQ